MGNPGPFCAHGTPWTGYCDSCWLESRNAQMLEVLASVLGISEKHLEQLHGLNDITTEDCLEAMTRWALIARGVKGGSDGDGN